MSVEAMSWVFKNSPYTLGTRLVHLALADVANDDHHWLVWASQPSLAKKAKVSVPTVGAALKQMVADGYLELVSRDGRGQATYRFLRPAPNATPKESEGSTSQDFEGSPPKSALSLVSTNQVGRTEELKRADARDQSSKVLPLAEGLKIARSGSPRGRGAA